MKTKSGLILALCIAFSIVPIFSFANKDSKQDKLSSGEPELTLIESLENGESFSIEITSIGCFHGKRQTILISKETNVVTASWGAISKLLTDEDIQTFKSFEIELRKLKMGGCSTVDTYVLRFGNQMFQTSDGTCSWHGYRPLIELFSE